MTQKTDKTAPAPSFAGELFTLADEIAKRNGKVFYPRELKDLRDDKPLMILPAGLQVLDLEKYLAAPVRIAQTVELLDLQGFVDYVNRHKAAADSLIFMDTSADKPGVLAVLDYHSEDNDPSWCSHRANYFFPETKEWDQWLTSNAVRMDQSEMGLFLEEHSDEIMKPEAAKLLDTIMRMKEVRRVTYGQATSLHNGMIEFQYVEENDGASGKFTLPEMIELRMAPFRDGEQYYVNARMRYRCNKDDGLQLWYELVRPDRVIEEAIKDVRDTVKDGTGLSVLAAKLKVG